MSIFAKFVFVKINAISLTQYLEHSISNTVPPTQNSTIMPINNVIKAPVKEASRSHSSLSLRAIFPILRAWLYAIHHF
ncbi:hypothetical protein [Xenorhabdus szentirmaii]|uniref:hypothetical protein n=1 Tax=Xenorhabdus szentirmaii TaxID=290112 RepID=UPI0004ACF891|nr:MULTISPECIES: hypothetical protein [unclassified Xenorhabdus]MBD2792290.1 hypothetical protein [Xenorhabdus sp. CUL]MBD2823729.1 hypothetical protein [Xenorhabdus sp. 5]